jgi:hypothetical protein
MNIKNSKKIVPATVFAAIIVLSAMVALAMPVGGQNVPESDFKPMDGWIWGDIPCSDVCPAPDDDIYTITSSDDGVDITVKDCCWITDRYEVHVNDVHIGTTPSLTCGVDGGTVLSQGTFRVFLTPGLHTLQFKNTCEPCFTGSAPCWNGWLPSGFSYKVENVDMIEVEKDYRYTNVCFEKDNDGDGYFSEDPIDGIDNDGDGQIDEDPVDCPDGTLLGTLLPIDDVSGNYIVEAVVKNDVVKSYNPGQYYAVSTVNVLEDVDTLTIVEDWCDCTEISALNPKNGGGCVVIVEVGPDGIAYQIHDAKSVGVMVVGCTATATLGAVSAGTTILMYVKFGPAQKHDDFEAGTCVNTNTAWVSIGDLVSVSEEDSATLELIKKE